MDLVVPVWKTFGITPLAAIHKFKEKYPVYLNEKISYAGRLDPMAEGVLVLLVGAENKNRSKYLELLKEYEAEFILGVSTDSHDALGMIEKETIDHLPELTGINSITAQFLGKQLQAYPPYSSKTVFGKPLFWWARSKRLSEVELPTRQIEISSIETRNISSISVDMLTKSILQKVKKVEGDFRQQEIVRRWKEFYLKNKSEKVLRVSLKIQCSSGTYIRRLAYDMGEKLLCGAFVYSLSRISVGGYEKNDCLSI